MSDSHTLLIVDDCPEDRDVYREYLSCDPNCSYDFIEASLAEVGLELFHQTRFDAILLDFWMPDMDGLEFLSEIQRRQVTEPEQAQPPIIMLTGQGNEAIAVKAIKQGVQDYLVKHHLQPEVLQLAVRNVIQQSQLHSLLTKTQERQRLIATTALRIRQSLDLDQILNTAVLEVQQLLECDHVGVYQMTEDSCMEVRAELGQREVSPAYGGSHGDLLAPIVIMPAPEVPDSPKRHTSLGNGSQPQTHQLWGYLVAHQSRKVTAWHVDEQDIVSELSVQLAIAIQQAELLAQTQAAYQKSQDLNHFKSQIIATVSHEYRTPLSTILAAATTLEEHGDRLEPERHVRFLQMIQDKARHMTTLTDQMLVMHQCELNQAKFEPSPLNVLQFVADLVDEHRDLVNGAYNLVLTVSGKTSGFWGDAGLLRLAIDNVLSNAIKYSVNGGIIEVNLIGSATDIQLSIQDYGIGIPHDEQKTLFQSFARGSNVRMIPGTGLGLAIVKACIDLHGGTITLISDETQGTNVILSFPKRSHGLVSDLKAHTQN